MDQKQTLGENTHYPRGEAPIIATLPTYRLRLRGWRLKKRACDPLFLCTKSDGIPLFSAHPFRTVTDALLGPSGAGRKPNLWMSAERKRRVVRGPVFASPRDEAY